jgi:hypothetical protein
LALVSETNFFQVQIAPEKLERYKTPGTDQILAALIQRGGETLYSEIYKLNYIWKNKNCTSSVSLHQFIRQVTKLH